MAKPDPKSIIEVLLKRYGKTFADELGVDAEAGTPPALFAVLLAALLSSARIGHTIALRAAHVLMERGWTSAEKMAATTWEQRVRALDEAGYARYDERTSTMLAQTAQMIIDQYEGDLGKLREAAGRDPAAERRLLKEFKGIGEVGANIFFREVQLAWPELFPFADDRVLASAAALGLPTDAKALAGLVRARRDFTRLVAALIRVQLEHRHDEIREEIRGRDTHFPNRVRRAG